MMKQLSIIIALFFHISIFAQSPEAINYQAVARNIGGSPLVNTAVNVRFEIRSGSSSGAAVYSETHATTTNAFGLFTAEIGNGTPVSGVFSGINWGSGTYYLYVEVNGDPIGATQLLSVPYALHAKTATSGVPGADGINCWDTNGNGIQDASEDINTDGVWDALDCQGAVGPQGVAGNDGLSINWLGTLSTVPGTPSINDAYYNSTDGKSYIYDGTNWNIIAQDGSGGITYTSGTGISLLGDSITNTSPDVPVTITGGGTTVITGTYPNFTITTTDNDTSSTNELQTLSINSTSDTIFLSNGGYVPLPSASGDTDWTQGTGVIYNTTDFVGIGTTTPAQKLSIVSPDSLIATFTGTNADVAAVTVAATNPNAKAGTIYLSGSDTGLIALDPSTKQFFITNQTTGGYTLVSADSVVSLTGKQVANIASDLNYNQSNRIYNKTDSIFNFSTSGTIVNVNQGMFLTDSLYVLGNNSSNTNWVLSNNGAGQAVWTDPSLIVTSGDGWGSQTAVTDGTTITGDGTAGSPITLATTIPTKTSDLTNDSGFITSPDDADSDPTNEIELPATASTNDVLIWNGSAWVAGVSPADGDSDPTNELELPMIGNTTGDILVWNGSSWVAGTDQTADGDTDPTNELELPMTGNTTGDILVWNGSSWVAGTDQTADGDTDATNELQSLTFASPNLSITGGNTVDLSTLSGPTYTPGTGIDITGNTISNTSLNTDDQQLTYNAGSQTLQLTTTTTPSTVTLNVDDADADATNEIQTLTFTSPNLTLSNGGGTVDLSGLSTVSTWKLNGNGGTNPSTNFIGTTDNNSLKFRTNNIERMILDVNGRVSLGTPITGLPLELQVVRENQSNSIGMAVFSNTFSDSPRLTFIKSRGTQASPLAPQGGDWLGSIGFSGYNGSSYTNSAGGLFMNAAENWTTSGNGSYLGFNTTSNGTTTAQERMRIDHNGFVGIGNTSPTAKLHLNGTLRLDNLSSTAPAIGSVLTSMDALGNAEWQPLPIAPTTYWDGTTGSVYPKVLTDNVGIGINSPNMKLHVVSNVQNNGALHVVNENAGTNTIVGGTKGARISVTSDGTEQKFGLEVELSGVGSGQQNAIFAQALGASTGSYNRGIVAAARNSSVSNIAADLFADGDAGVNYGLRVFTGGTQASSKYAAYLTSSGSGTKYGLYSVGEDINYFSGAVGIGINSPSEALDVDNGGSIEVDGEYTYESPKTHYYTLSAKDFVGGSPHNGDNWNNTGNIIYSYFDVTGNSFPIANAGFQIPDGARITDITAFIWDDDGSITYQPRFMVYEVLMASGSYGLVGTATLASDAASVQQLSIPLNKVVDNVNRSYHIKFQSAGDAGSNIRLYGVRITYTVDKAD